MFPERLIEPGSVTATASGFRADLRLTWYRALPLSCVAQVTVTVDGEHVPQDQIRLGVAGHEPQPVAALAPLTDVWWYVLDPAELVVDHEPATGNGHHLITVVLGMYIPYLPVDDRFVVNLETCSAPLAVAS